MDELLPILSGFILGIAFAFTRRSTRDKAALIAVIVVTGSAATVVSGEIYADPRLFLFDIAQCGVAALAAIFLSSLNVYHFRGQKDVGLDSRAHPSAILLGSICMKVGVTKTSKVSARSS